MCEAKGEFLAFQHAVENEDADIRQRGAQLDGFLEGGDEEGVAAGFFKGA